MHAEAKRYDVLKNAGSTQAVVQQAQEQKERVFCVVDESQVHHGERAATILAREEVKPE